VYLQCCFSIGIIMKNQRVAKEEAFRNLSLEQAQQRLFTVPETLVSEDIFHLLNVYPNLIPTDPQSANFNTFLTRINNKLDHEDLADLMQRLHGDPVRQSILLAGTSTATAEALMALERPVVTKAHILYIINELPHAQAMRCLADFSSIAATFTVEDLKKIILQDAGVPDALRQKLNALQTFANLEEKVGAAMKEIRPPSIYEGEMLEADAKDILRKMMAANDPLPVTSTALCDLMVGNPGIIPDFNHVDFPRFRDFVQKTINDIDFKDIVLYDGWPDDKKWFSLLMASPVRAEKMLDYLTMTDLTNTPKKLTYVLQFFPAKIARRVLENYDLINAYSFDVQFKQGRKALKKIEDVQDIKNLLMYNTSSTNVRLLLRSTFFNISAVEDAVTEIIDFIKSPNVIPDIRTDFLLNIQSILSDFPASYTDYMNRLSLKPEVLSQLTWEKMSGLVLQMAQHTPSFPLLTQIISMLALSDHNRWSREMNSTTINMLVTSLHRHPKLLEILFEKNQDFREKIDTENLERICQLSDPIFYYVMKTKELREKLPVRNILYHLIHRDDRSMVEMLKEILCPTSLAFVDMHKAIIATITSFELSALLMKHPDMGIVLINQYKEGERDPLHDLFSKLNVSDLKRMRPLSSGLAKAIDEHPILASRLLDEVRVSPKPRVEGGSLRQSNLLQIEAVASSILVGGKKGLCLGLATDAIAKHMQLEHAYDFDYRYTPVFERAVQEATNSPQVLFSRSYLYRVQNYHHTLNEILVTHPDIKTYWAPPIKQASSFSLEQLVTYIIRKIDESPKQNQYIHLNSANHAMALVVKYDKTGKNRQILFIDPNFEELELYRGPATSEHSSEAIFKLNLRLETFYKDATELSTFEAFTLPPKIYQKTAEFSIKNQAKPLDPREVLGKKDRLEEKENRQPVSKSQSDAMVSQQLVKEKGTGLQQSAAATSEPEETTRQKKPKPGGGNCAIQ